MAASDETTILGSKGGEGRGQPIMGKNATDAEREEDETGSERSSGHGCQQRLMHE